MGTFSWRMRLNNAFRYTSEMGTAAIAKKLQRESYRSSVRRLPVAKSHAKRYPSSASFAEEAAATAKKERDIQREMDRSDKRKHGGRQEDGAMQAGARLCPVPCIWLIAAFV
jgi:hypothetical protein